MDGLHTGTKSFNQDELFDENDSIASELLHLHDAEDLIHRELMGIGCDSSFSIFKSELQHLTDAEEELGGATSAWALPFEVSQDSIPQLEEDNEDLTTITIASSKDERREYFGLKRQISEGSFQRFQDNLENDFRSLRAHDNASIRSSDLEEDIRRLIDTEVSRGSPNRSPYRNLEQEARRIESPPLLKMSQVSYSTHDQNYEESSKETRIERLAALIFGRDAYQITPALSTTRPKESCERTVQGGVCVAMATAVVISKIYHNSTFLPVILALLPPSIAWTEANLPHTIEETTLALGIITVHLGITHAYSLG